MKEFLGKDFLIDNGYGQKLYDTYASAMPIFDFHCHLSPKEIAEDKRFADLAEVWLGGDHYKWRLMREAGIEEKYISGNASGKEKFLKFASVLPFAAGNPIYHWAHLELRRFFGIDKILSPSTAEEIWAEANEKLQTLSAREMIVSSNVRALCTTDDPVDDLSYHAKIAADGFKVKVLPAFRPDKAINAELPSFLPWLEMLKSAYGRKINDFSDFLSALKARAEFFDRAGCVCSDHALDVVLYEKGTEEEAGAAFAKAAAGQALNPHELAVYKGYVLVFLGKLYNKLGWVQQYHIGALRNLSGRSMRKYGADTGFDAIGDTPFAPALAGLLDELDATDELPKTILYCLNPRDNEVLSAMKNCFQKAGTAARIQFGSAWWFNDQKDGMTRQLESLAQLGLLSHFVGMLTDSRSFLSYPRHEYFRRILCNKLGRLVEDGEYPCDLPTLAKIVEDICYNNAVKFFDKKNN